MTGHQHQHAHRPNDADLTEMIALESEALRELTDQVTLWVAETIEAPPRHVLDLGSGTGAGTAALLERFPETRVTAVDSSPHMLARLERLAPELDRPARLQTLRVDLDDAVPVIQDVDLVWASSSLHHMKDPDRVIAEVAALLPVGGWVFVVESEDIPWFLPEDLGIGPAGLERRCHELLSAHREASLPDVGSDWGVRLTAAGLALTSVRTFDFDVSGPLPHAAQRYARALFNMLRGAAHNQLNAQDVATLDVLLDEADPRGLTRREDVSMRTTRKAWAARRTDNRQDTP